MHHPRSCPRLHGVGIIEALDGTGLAAVDAVQARTDHVLAGVGAVARAALVEDTLAGVSIMRRGGGRTGSDQSGGQNPLEHRGGSSTFQIGPRRAVVK